MADAKGTSISAVSDLFNSLEQLKTQIKTRGEVELEEACTKLWHQAEIITECLAYRVQLYNSAKSDVLFMSDAFWRTIQILVPLKKELTDLKQYCKEMKLADEGIDPRPIELPTVIQEGNGMKHATSYDDFKKQKLQQASSISSSGTTTPVPSFGIRKARSHPDVNMHNIQKELESLRIDSKRLKESEKKLLKETLVLNRKCKVLTEARDRAEDRLKIEQTQRDSIEKLRQRNRELEEQVHKLQQRQVIKDKEKEEVPYEV